MNDDSARTEDDPRQEERLHQRLVAGEENALGELFDLHRDRLWRMVQFRMDSRLAARVDADDILQESFVNAASRVQHYLEDPSRSLFVWFRLIVGQTLVDVYRRHIAAEMRDAGREVSLQGMRYPQATSVSLAAELLGSITSPSQAVHRAEVSAQLELALKEMSELDQEVIALRHFEDLTNGEVAEVLGIQPTAASNRYVRALTRLKDVLSQFPELDG